MAEEKKEFNPIEEETVSQEQTEDILEEDDENKPFKPIRSSDLIHS